MVASYSFNNGNAKDDLGKLHAKEVGVSYVEDRFGNKNTLKPDKGSVSLWANIDIAIESGKGYKMNPIILTKCMPTDSFFEAYCIYYDYGRKKIACGSTLSKFNQAGINSSFSPKLQTWYHIVYTLC